MERISKYQLGAMIILFQIGSTPLFELGIKAGQDAWLVVITSMLLGFMLLFLFLIIQRREPEKNLSQLLIQYFGSFVGKFVLLLYVLMFSYEAMRNVRDFGDLTLLTILPRGPISLIMLIMITLSIYAIYKGIEVFFRLAEFIVVGVLTFYLILLIMQLVSGVVHFDYLLPILENGIQPVLKESISSTVWFPFGQMMIFLMFWRYLNEKKELAKTSVRSFFVSGLVILFSNIMNLIVLGPQLLNISTVPLLQAVQLIQIAEVFERFDALVILLFYAGIFIKATLWFLAAVLGLSQLFQTDYRRFALPVGVIIYITSLLPSSWQLHLEIGKIVGEQFMLNKIFIGVIPAILFLVMLIKGQGKQIKG
ncbi:MULTISPECIES: GerAB/ArcD/ProY family transporter [unclassified Paenibacillus]|uniref:GerAB/ArcD/ProY family transporter n=1 Tax=unclassified Paenibacillus TaxID=185978 RepID=UPI0027851E93|nr:MULTISPECIES: GerAB/ArcD/ProY family transporter [unclassified Paenibacillus]MDQ0900621.1 spore germination protein KB [Paenibacillus sp. V4I7]MDQ0920871.1 spore germination protein KB [Paenibacillus sp. V4I5]